MLPSAEELVIRYQRALTPVAGRRRGTRRRRIKELLRLLWERLEPLVRALAVRFRYCARAAHMDVDDLVSEAWLKIVRVLPRFDPGRGTKLKTWLWHVLTNYFIQVAREHHPESRGDMDELAAGDRGTSADSEVTRLTVHEVLDGLLLGDLQRERKLRAFKLYWLQGYTLADIAAKEHPPVVISTVAGWLTQVRAAFRVALAASERA